jgi:hypothetical protein
MGGDNDQWYPKLFTDCTPIDQPATPEEGYHLSEDLVDKSIELIANNESVDPVKPWLLYLSFGACHAPHHVWPEWIEKYRGRFDIGWDAYREQVLARQKEIGVVPEGARSQLQARPGSQPSGSSRDPGRAREPHLPAHRGANPRPPDLVPISRDLRRRRRSRCPSASAHGNLCRRARLISVGVASLHDRRAVKNVPLAAGVPRQAHRGAKGASPLGTVAPREPLAAPARRPKGTASSGGTNSHSPGPSRGRRAGFRAARTKCCASTCVCGLELRYRAAASHRKEWCRAYRGLWLDR